jgi:hypothetical protein
LTFLFLREKRKRKKEVNWQRDSLFAEGQFVERVEMAAVLLFMYLLLLLLFLSKSVTQKKKEGGGRSLSTTNGKRAGYLQTCIVSGANMSLCINYLTRL